MIPYVAVLCKMYSFALARISENLGKKYVIIIIIIDFSSCSS